MTQIRPMRGQETPFVRTMRAHTGAPHWRPNADLHPDPKRWPISRAIAVALAVSLVLWALAISAGKTIWPYLQ